MIICSNRAKCIKCSFCGLFFSPNKFIFHSHRLPESKYVQPDAANFNSWRRHIKLDGTPPEEVSVVWEDVKAMFNGGSRKRAMAASLNSVTRSSSKVLTEHCTKKARIDLPNRDEVNSKVSTHSLIESNKPKVLTAINQSCLPLPPLTSKDYSSTDSTSSFSANLTNLTNTSSGSNKYLNSLHSQADFRTSLADLMWSSKQPPWGLPYNCVLWPRPPAGSSASSASLSGHIFNPLTLRDHKSSCADRLISTSNHWLMPMDTPFLLNSARQRSLVDNISSNSTNTVSAFKPINKYKNEKMNSILSESAVSEEETNKLGLAINSESEENDADVDVIGNDEDNKFNGVAHDIIKSSQANLRKEFDEFIWKHEMEKRAAFVFRNKLDKNLSNLEVSV